MEKTQLNTKKPVHIDVTIKKGTWIDPQKYIDRIADAGYAARKEDIRLTLTGQLAKEGERLILTMSDVGAAPVKFAVVEGKGKDAAETKQMAEALDATTKLAGQTVEVEGWWRPVKQKTAGALVELAVVRVILPSVKKE